MDKHGVQPYNIVYTCKHDDDDGAELSYIFKNEIYFKFVQF